MDGGIRMKWVLKFGSYKEKDDIFDLVVQGTKTIETRPANLEKKRNYTQIKPGDKLILLSLDSGRRLEKTVLFVHVYKSVRQMVLNEPAEEIWPGAGSAEKLVQIFEELKKKWGRGYSAKLEKYGIVAIGME